MVVVAAQKLKTKIFQSSLEITVTAALFVQ